jgi:uncharacterized protein YjiS (DUF1127 family)
MSNILPTLSALAGIASIAAIASYYLPPSLGAAFTSAGLAVAGWEPAAPSDGPIIAMLNALRRSIRRHQAIETLLKLDDHLLRDVGLTGGIVVSIRPADGRPRGLYADMIADRLRSF